MNPTSHQEDSDVDPLGELERFVLDNEDLFELEAQLGGFNLFEALRLERVEIRHSNFLAWILDPSESHGFSATCLTALLMDMLSVCPRELRPLNPIEIDGIDLRNVEVRREWRGIDVLVMSKEPSFVLCIENKIGSSEHGNQLERYETEVERSFPRVPTQFIYLTVDGSEASRDDWVTYTYGDVHRVLERIRRMHAGAIGDDVALFIDHYLGLIRSHFMENEQIEELVRRIYRNHRRALNLIFEYAPIGNELQQKIEDWLATEKGRWHVFNTTSRRIEIVRADWDGVLPSIGTRASSAQHWLVITVRVGEDSCRLFVDVKRTTDVGLQRDVLDRLVRDPDEFGFGIKRKSEAHWKRIFNQRIAKWGEGEDPDEEKVLKMVKAKLGELYERTEGVGNALAEVVRSSPQ